MPASSEFITLCRTQVSLLVEGFGASKSAIYLTEDPTADRETALIPLVMFPEVEWPEPIPFVLPESVRQSLTDLQSPLEIQTITQEPSPNSSNPNFSNPHPSNPHPSNPIPTQPLPTQPLPAQRPSLAEKQVDASPFINHLTVFGEALAPKQVVLPLMYDNLMWGLMVVGREHRRWSDREQAQLEQIAQTLAISCVLDQRSQWLIHNHDQRLLLENQQQTTLSTLLHQFRNPLTTLRTLGKLLLKRVSPEDPNREVIRSMVNESTHLEHLLRRFDDAIDLGEAALESDWTAPRIALPPALPPGTSPSSSQAWSSTNRALNEAVNGSVDGSADGSVDRSVDGGLNKPSAKVALSSTAWLNGGALTLQPCWLSEIVQPILSAIAGRIDEQNLQFHATIPDELPPVKADPTALREVLGNLLDNALKYTPPGGEIWLSMMSINHPEQAQQQLPQQQLQISDTGPGIPPQDLARIFERSYRGVQAATSIPGTGLGLAIAKDLMTQMEGNLEVHSPSLMPKTGSIHSPGSTFIVTLPEYNPD
ncbi:MAG: ATP-binding protein [Thermosynechococcaceae cyanobacterium MS004]|nr:ATP-binding protein [Thermosynechococcaceae cyanobacterium MS004]